jgi:FHS family L-fucose permease-like MFS transporter
VVKIGGSFLVMAIIGGAILTPLMGLVSEKFHCLALAFTIPLMAYVYITLYSFLGSRRAAITTAVPDPARPKYAPP